MVQEQARAVVIATVLTFAGVGYGIRAQNAPAPTAKAIGMEFVKVAPGEFMMGCSTGDDQCEADEKPLHRIRITKGFEIGKYEVTQAQWTAVMGSNPSSNKGDRLPVETVSKLEAQEFLEKLGATNDGYTYRLPTEAEWEFAARAGGNTTGALDQVAWYAGNSEDETHPVGQKKANGWGLHDMQGNVREWVSDLYSPTYYSVSPEQDPAGVSPSSIVGQGPGGFRGGPAGQGGPGGQRGRGGRGGPGGPGFANVPPPVQPPPPLPPDATLQQQVDALRQQVEQLQREVQFLRSALDGGPLRGGPQGFRGGELGPPAQGPAVEIRPGVLVDPLDGLPTGLPIVRGGGWDQSAKFQRVSARYSYYGPTLRVSDIGFRAVRTPR